MTSQNLTLAAVASATTDYSVCVEGDTFAPYIVSGQRLTVRPAVNADPAEIAPRSLVVAIAAPDPAQPRRFRRPALFRMNGDGDLDGGSAIVPAGTYIVLGIARDKAIAPQKEAPRH